jgi:hypothetical protein
MDGDLHGFAATAILPATLATTPDWHKSIVMLAPGFEQLGDFLAMRIKKIERPSRWAQAL